MNKIILLVEDNPSDIMLTKRALDQNKITNKLVVAENGREALDYLLGAGKYAGRDVRELPAVVLLDLKLPLIDGLEVLKEIRSNEFTRLLPVVILTSSDQEKDIIDSYKLGANSYIRKPVDFHQFADAVRTLGMYWLLLNEAPPLI
ncbi:MAG: response regulator [Smithella sp.]|jgi:CheY-like chemotaxis protein